MTMKSNALKARALQALLAFVYRPAAFASGALFSPPSSLQLYSYPCPCTSLCSTLARPGYNCTPNKLLPVRFNTHLVRILVVSTRRRRFPNDAFVAEFAHCAVAETSPLQKPRHVQNTSSILVRIGVLCTRRNVILCIPFVLSQVRSAPIPLEHGAL